MRRAGLRDVGGAKEFGRQVSAERARLLDIGVLVWFTTSPEEGAKVRRRPVYRKLDVRTEGRDLFVSEGGAMYAALSGFISVLSIPLIIEELVRRLAAVAYGDPATRPKPLGLPFLTIK